MVITTHSYTRTVRFMHRLGPCDHTICSAIVARSNAVHRRCHWPGTCTMHPISGSKRKRSKILANSRRSAVRRVPPTRRSHAHARHGARTCATPLRPLPARETRPKRSDGRYDSSVGQGGRGLRSPAKKRARLTVTYTSAMHWCVQCGVVGREKCASAPVCRHNLAQDAEPHCPASYASPGCFPAKARAYRAVMLCRGTLQRLASKQRVVSESNLRVCIDFDWQAHL